MAKNHKRNRKQATSPYQILEPASARLPRMAPRGRLGLNTVLHGNEALANTTSDASGIVAGSCLLVPGYGADTTTGAVAAIAQYYATGKYLPGTVLHYVPQVSLSTSGTVYMAFTDNPETIASFSGAPTNAAKLSVVRSIANVRNYPVWQQFTFAMPLTMRRKMFDVNSDISPTDVNALDRSAQGCFIYAVEGVPVSSVICRPWVHKKIQLEGLRSTAT